MSAALAHVDAFITELKSSLLRCGHRYDRECDGGMIDILDTIARWRAAGQRVGLATLVQVENSAPRDPGAVIAISETGEVAGSLSGGCVESAVFEEVQHAIASGQSRLVTYGISDGQATEYGLTCGGTLHVFVERLDWGMEFFDRLAKAIRADTPIALVTRIDDAGRGAKIIVAESGCNGSLGSRGLDVAVESEARALLAAAQTSLREFGADGEPSGVDVRVFIQSFASKRDMFVFGAIDFSRAMATMGKYLGYRVTVIDARPVFATKQRIPDADEIVISWPDEFLSGARVSSSTVVVVLTHDVKFDVPLLQVALATKAGYIGVMGSRRTHANRLAALRKAGVPESAFIKLHAPVGLDIGARTPEETAVSIAAEIVASRSGRSGGSLRDSAFPVHAAAPEFEKVLR